MELEPVAQREAVGLAVVADGPAVDHLRLRLELDVAGEQRVVDHVGVDADDGLRAPEGIDRAHVGMHRHAQGLGLLRRGGERQRERQRGAERQRRSKPHARPSGTCAHSLLP